MLVSGLCFIMVNTFVKLLGPQEVEGFKDLQHYPAHELVLARSIVSVIISFLVIKKKKIPIHTKKSINKIFFEEGKKQGIYLRTLGNIVMLVPPLSIRENELEMLLTRTIKTIQAAKSKIIWLLTTKNRRVNNYHIFINGIENIWTWVL